MQGPLAGQLTPQLDSVEITVPSESSSQSPTWRVTDRSRDERSFGLVKTAAPSPAMNIAWGARSTS